MYVSLTVNVAFLITAHKHHHTIGSTPASYSGSSVFESQSGDQLSLFRFFIVFLSLPPQVPA